ncbi:hypothetical protein [Streptomyces sp. NPDC002156]
MPSMKAIAAATAVGLVLVGAVVYGGIRLADSVDHDFAAPFPAPSASSTWLPAPYDTLSPAQYHFGDAVAHAAGRDVVAYVPQQHSDHVLTVPFTITNHGSEPYDYEITVTVTGAIDPGMPQSAHISSAGMLPPNATMSTEINFESRGDEPVRDIDVRIANVNKKGET